MPGRRPGVPRRGVPQRPARPAAQDRRGVIPGHPGADLTTAVPIPAAPILAAAPLGPAARNQADTSPAGTGDTAQVATSRVATGEAVTSRAGTGPAVPGGKTRTGPDAIRRPAGIRCPGATLRPGGIRCPGATLRLDATLRPGHRRASCRPSPARRLRPGALPRRGRRPGTPGVRNLWGSRGPGAQDGGARCRVASGSSSSSPARRSARSPPW
jgi:hypothetical protein